MYRFPDDFSSRNLIKFHPGAVGPGEVAYAVTQHVGPPDIQTHHLLAPTAGGTRLELTLRWPAGAFKDNWRVRRRMAKDLQETANGYQTMIEQSAQRA
jgi:hypothetical protein